MIAGARGLIGGAVSPLPACSCYALRMSDQTDDPAETPMQRALRLKKAAQDAKPKTPGGKVSRAQAAMPSGASKPWLKR